MEITGTTAAQAGQLLQETNWNVEAAIDLHFNRAADAINSQQIPKLEALFEAYKDEEDPQIIGIDGTLQYIEDLGKQPEDLVVLALAEFLNSPSTGVFRKTDFVNQWASANVGTIEEMTQKVQDMDRELYTNISFLQRIYEFAFRYMLEGGQRSLNPDIAVDYWRLFLPVNFAQDRVDRWCSFIVDHHKYAISRDQWHMTFEFFVWWAHNDLKDYDESAAWPSLMDAFFENQTDPEAA